MSSASGPGADRGGSEGRAALGLGGPAPPFATTSASRARGGGGGASDARRLRNESVSRENVVGDSAPASASGLGASRGERPSASQETTDASPRTDGGADDPDTTGDENADGIGGDGGSLVE